MPISFDQVLPSIRDKVTTDATLNSTLFPSLKAITIIRDASGLVRVLLEPAGNKNLPEGDPGVMRLRDVLDKELGVYFGKDIWYTQRHFGVLKSLIDVVRKDPIPAPWDKSATSPRWYLLERHIAKHLWTRHLDEELPWPTEPVERAQQPAVVTFFSFKGGIGRTTALAGTAVALARRGHRVAMVDLDLEAPGLNSFFFAGEQDDQGVVDYLIEKRVQGNAWALRPYIRQIVESAVLGNLGQPLRLLPAGKVDATFLEKLARIDFQHMTTDPLVREHSTPHILRQMLKELRDAAAPLDFIFLDARSGFHDLGGFALSTLSHAAVLFASQSRQNWAGTARAIELLAQPRNREQVPLVLVHGMAPSPGTPGRDVVLKTFRETAYDVFQQHYYREDDPIPNTNDTDAPFTPVEISWQMSLRGDLLLAPREDAAEESSRVAALVGELVTACQPIAEKICQLFDRPLEKIGIHGN